MCVMKVHEDHALPRAIIVQSRHCRCEKYDQTTSCSAASTIFRAENGVDTMTPQLASLHVMLARKIAARFYNDLIGKTYKGAGF